MLRTLVLPAILLACDPPGLRLPSEVCGARPVLENDPSPDAVALSVKIENVMKNFEPVDICILVDGHAVKQPTPAAFVQAFNAHYPLEFRVALDPRTEHVVFVHAKFVTPAFEGYKFDVQSSHVVPRNGRVLTGTFKERGDQPRLERRPTVEWTESPDPPAAPPASGS